jgi:flagellar basal-body rod modification protein FlgD
VTTTPIGGIGSTGSTAATTTASSSSADLSSTDQLNEDTFLKLMVAQLRNQDPMNPTDSSQFLAQTAQFSSLEKLNQVADQSAQALSAQMAFGASGLVGRTITYTDTDGNAQTGPVGSVNFTASGPMLDVGGTDVPISSVVSVSA